MSNDKREPQVDEIQDLSDLANDPEALAQELADQADAEDEQPEETGPRAITVMMTQEGPDLTIGIRQEGADPLIHFLPNTTIHDAAENIHLMVEEAKQQWAEHPLYPDYIRPPAGSATRTQESERNPNPPTQSALL